VETLAGSTPSTKGQGDDLSRISSQKKNYGEAILSSTQGHLSTEKGGGYASRVFDERLRAIPSPV